MNNSSSALSALSLGTFCYTANILKALGLRKAAYPLDYTFENIGHVNHMLSTNFKYLLDRSLIYPAISNQTRTTTGHLIYGHIFRHHDLINNEVYERMLIRVERLRMSLSAGTACFITLNEAHRDPILKVRDQEINLPKMLEFTEQCISRYSGMNQCIFIQLRHAFESKVHTYTLPSNRTHTSVCKRTLIIDVASNIGNIHIDRLGKKIINIQDGARLYCKKTEGKLKAQIMSIMNM
jgi:hypothetical protein